MPTGTDFKAKSVMHYTLKKLKWDILWLFGAIPKEFALYFYEEQRKNRDLKDQLKAHEEAMGHLAKKLSDSAESNAKLLKTIDFQRAQIEELTFKTQQPAPEPKSEKKKDNFAIPSRSGWRAVAQMRSIQTIPGPDNDSVAQLEHRAQKEASR